MTKKLKVNYWLIEEIHSVKNAQRFLDEDIWVNSSDEINADIINTIKANDIIAIKTNITKKNEVNEFISSLRIKVIGKVAKNLNNGKNLEVKWEKESVSYDVDNLVKTGKIYQLTDENEINSIFFPEKKKIDFYSKIVSKKTIYSKHPLNQIFYGSPGTGKTYKAITTALEIIDGFFPQSPTEVKNKFKYYQEKGQISFLTFHDSYTYNDFVETLRANQSDNELGKIEYQIKTGIFKEIANTAKAELFKVSNVVDLDSEDNKIKFFKASIGKTAKDKGDNTYNYCLSNNFIALDMLGGIDYSILENTKNWLKAQDEIREVYFSEEDEETKRLALEAIYYFKNYMRAEDIVFISNDNKVITAIGRVTGRYYEFKDIVGVSFHHFRKVEWLIKDCSIPVEKFYKRKFSNQVIYELDKRDLILSNIRDFIGTKKVNNYVLIIDEINRGYIPKIFGELITLIETPKRIGNQEELLIKLPYSNQEFGVPKNLYIIGTMNSIINTSSNFDQTLRRRFNFIETNVDYSKINIKIDGIEIDKLLKSINLRIEYFLGKDYCIGHTYFMELIQNPSFELLKTIFKDKIIPFLKNNFMGDWEKIILVLGDNQKSDKESMFIQSNEIDYKNLFGQNDYSELKNFYNINIPDSPENYISIYKNNNQI